MSERSSKTAARRGPARHPAGLVRCPDCGGFYGSVRLDELAPTSASFRAGSPERLTVNCACETVPCPHCGQGRVPRPHVLHYNPVTRSVRHVPFYEAWAGCGCSPGTSSWRSARLVRRIAGRPGRLCHLT